MNGIFGYGSGFDAMMFEEWDRDALIEKILNHTNDYTHDELNAKSLDALKSIAEEVF